MGIVSVEKANHLYWLGRYTERVFTTLKGFISVYDNMLDSDPTAYKKYCESIGITDIYQSKDDFIVHYINDISDGNSIINSLHRAYDNGIVLRGEIGSETLGYLQMAINCFDEYAAGSFSLYRYQRVLDFLYAFWGCADDCVEDETSRNILKCGRYMERLDLYLRLKMPYSKIEKEYSKLKNRTEKSRLSVNENAKMRLSEILDQKEEWQKEYIDAINSLEGLFII